MVPSPAQAEDSLFGTRGGDQMSEREHAIALTFERGHATLVVQRTIHNGLDQHDEAQFWLDIPASAVATGVRTLGYVDGEPRWYEGELLEAEQAAARYQELTGRGGYYPKDPVLLSWRDPTLLAMQVFPVEPMADKTVEYTLTMPATWVEGRWRIELPAIGSATLPAELTLDPGQTLDQIFVDGEVVGRHHLLDMSVGALIELAPSGPAPVTLKLASVDTGEQRHLVEFEVALAPELAELPKRAQIVVALDLSRSRTDAQVEAQRRAAIAYLEHFRDPALRAEVALIGFDREVHPLSAEPFVDAAQAIEALTQATLVRRNGSDLGEALGHASALLDEHAPARAPRRILLLTDFATASRLTPDRLTSVVDRSKAIVHIASVEAGRAELARADDHAWANLAARTQGVLWTAAAPSEDDPSEAEWALDVFEEWARPVRIDELRVSAEGLRLAEPDVDLGFPSSLAEGEGVAFLDLSFAAVRSLEIAGKTWNRPFEQRARPSREHGDLWSALVFGSSELYSLSEAEMMVLAMRGRAVSPVTSYLAIEPGVRPSTEGIEPWERGAFGIGMGSASGGSSFGQHAEGFGVAFDPHAWLLARLDEARTRCGGADQPFAVELETTFAEIVEVTLAGAGLDAEVEACVRQSIWSIELPGQFDRDFVGWSLSVP
ncbi:VWA domain-containing protein [Nannocystaceae bacterium ST9]